MKEETKTFSEWLTTLKQRPKIKTTIKKVEFRCINCGDSDIKRRSNMDSLMCDFCWNGGYSMMAATF